ncbi:P-loop containing nucleoside triphosphate hydrolase protein [Anaeromyces robustus]|uniref:p-loop containing nucleoside triphosphate hydrolase protein n=1 Tax=Anaeromyces robustus TaxID=1754192 RepID=A0A1Y1X5J7_9FUNG|nr:P-loop containing nucleoside triphosphate hydrolase protein [Anaeromyces robustus]|eukprot:ORX81091.1 P-loop containing nucleoside triphosphate hydrolase protein [Anaeromyces robustus]
MQKIKIVILGDANVGKKLLIHNYTTNKGIKDYTPTSYDNYEVTINICNRPYVLELTSVEDSVEYEKVRPLCYANTDVFLLCYNVTSFESMESVHHKWCPEIRKFCPGTPYILVGTQIDRVKDKKTLDELNIDGQNLAKEINAVAFIPCSSDTGEGIKDVFNKAIVAALDPGAEIPDDNNCIIQ